MAMPNSTMRMPRTSSTHQYLAATDPMPRTVVMTILSSLRRILGHDLPECDAISRSDHDRPLDRRVGKRHWCPPVEGSMDWRPTPASPGRFRAVLLYRLAPGSFVAGGKERTEPTAPASPVASVHSCCAG